MAVPAPHDHIQALECVPAVDQHGIPVSEPNALKCSVSPKMVKYRTSGVLVALFPQPRFSASLGFQRALDVIKLVGKPVGRHDASSRRKGVVCRELLDDSIKEVDYIRVRQ